MMDLHAFGAERSPSRRRTNRTRRRPRGEVGKFLGRVRHSCTYAVLVNGKVVETSSVLVDEEHLARCGLAETMLNAQLVRRRDSVAVLRFTLCLQ